MENIQHLWGEFKNCKPTLLIGSFLKTSLQKVKALVVVCLALFFKITCLAITEDMFVSDPFNGTVTLMYSITVAESVQVPKEC